MAKTAAAEHMGGNAKLGRRILDRWQLYLLLILPLAWLITFCYVPMGGLVLAFKKYTAASCLFKSIKFYENKTIPFIFFV